MSRSDDGDDEDDNNNDDGDDDGRSERVMMMTMMEEGAPATTTPVRKNDIVIVIPESEKIKRDEIVEVNVLLTNGRKVNWLVSTSSVAIELRQNENDDGDDEDEDESDENKENEEPSWRPLSVVPEEERRSVDLSSSSSSSSLLSPSLPSSSPQSYDFEGLNSISISRTKMRQRERNLSPIIVYDFQSKEFSRVFLTRDDGDGEAREGEEEKEEEEEEEEEEGGGGGEREAQKGMKVSVDLKEIIPGVRESLLRPTQTEMPRRRFFQENESDDDEERERKSVAREEVFFKKLQEERDGRKKRKMGEGDHGSSSKGGGKKKEEEEDDDDEEAVAPLVCDESVERLSPVYAREPRRTTTPTGSMFSFNSCASHPSRRGFVEDTWENDSFSVRRVDAKPLEECVSDDPTTIFHRRRGSGEERSPPSSS